MLARQTASLEQVKFFDKIIQHARISNHLSECTHDYGAQLTVIVTTEVCSWQNQRICCGK